MTRDFTLTSAYWLGSTWRRSKLYRLRSSQHTETCYISFNQQVCSLQKLQQGHENPILKSFAPLKVSLALPLMRSTWCFNTDYQTRSVNPRLAWSWLGKSWQEEWFYSYTNQKCAAVSLPLVCIYMKIYIYIYIHTHTHTHTRDVTVIGITVNRGEISSLAPC